MFCGVGLISNKETPLYSTINRPTNIIGLTCDLIILTNKSYIKNIHLAIRGRVATEFGLQVDTSSVQALGQSFNH